MPKIDLASIPGLDTATALFGAISERTAGPDDVIIEIMVYVYDTAPPSVPGLF
ncbi:MAG: hypothetical protein ACX930_04915 [Erythrobacter sp.]